LSNIKALECVRDEGGEEEMFVGETKYAGAGGKGTIRYRV